MWASSPVAGRLGFRTAPYDLFAGGQDERERVLDQQASSIALLVLCLVLLGIWFEGALDGALWTRSLWLLHIAGVSYTAVRLVSWLRDLSGI